MTFQNTKAPTSLASFRNVSLLVQHSFFDVADGYKPRRSDPAVNNYATWVNALAPGNGSPVRDKIERWRMIKRDSSLAVSDPLEPIEIFIARDTPEDLLGPITRGVEAWNKAFEAAGFSNAIDLKMQPFGSDRERDITKTLIRVIDSPISTWTGYGPTITDPRSGEIIAATILLERQSLRMVPGISIGGRHITGEANSETASAIYGSLSLGFESYSPAEVERLERLSGYAIARIVCHEVGHVLGLSHNFKGSLQVPYSPLGQEFEVAANGQVGSALDYWPMLDLKTSRYGYVSEGASLLSPFDVWSIEFTYKTYDNHSDEFDDRLHLLSKASMEEMSFGDPAIGQMDATSQPWDYSAQPLQHAGDELQLIHMTLLQLAKKVEEQDFPSRWVLNAFERLLEHRALQAEIVAQFLSSVQHQSHSTDPSFESLRLVPTPREDKKMAMAILRRHVFSQESLLQNPELLSHLMPERRQTSGPPMFVHERLLEIQEEVLTQILHPLQWELRRDSALYGNDYSSEELLRDLTEAIFEDDLEGSLTSQRADLQFAYIRQLIRISKDQSRYGSDGVAFALREAAFIQELLRKANRPDASTAAYRNAALSEIETELDLSHHQPTLVRQVANTIIAFKDAMFPGASER